MLAKLYLLQVVAYKLGISLARALEIRFSFFLVVNSKTISYKGFVVKYCRHFNEVPVAIKGLYHRQILSLPISTPSIQHFSTFH